MKIVMFVGRRLVRLVLCLFAVSLLTFGLLQLAPGDFAGIQEAGGGNVSLAQQATSETRSELSDRYGAEVPIWQQYTTFMAGALTGDMGPSYRYPHRTVEQIIASGGHLWACRMSADMNHLTEEDLYEEVEGIISASDFIEKTEGAQLLFI